MRRFADLYERLDASTATTDKLAALVAYFAAAPPADAAWAVYFLAGGKPRQVVPTAVLRETATALAGIDDWLFEECYQAVGDLAETIAHVVPDAVPEDRRAEGVDALSDKLVDAPEASIDAADGSAGRGLAFWVEQRLLPLRGLAAAEQRRRLEAALCELDAAGRFLLVKLIGGGFRVGVSRLLVQRALASHAGVDAKLVAERMMGYTEAGRAPDAARYLALLAPAAAPPAGPGGGTVRDSGQPYPFFLAHPLAGDVAALGAVDDWLVEWKYDGIRAQLVHRGGRTWIWSRGEELVTDRFPELPAAAAALPDGTVLDGEILVWPAGSGRPASFQRLQQRIGRKSVTKKLLAEAPAVFVAYDLLEHRGLDLRARPQHDRRAALEALPLAAAPDGEAVLRLAPPLAVADWAEAAARRAAARGLGFEGLMLKQRRAAYGSGRTRADGVWWKWKVDPLAVDAVLVYAQAGHGRRAGVYTDYTFAVWSRPPRDAAEAEAVLQAIAGREPAPPRGSDALQLLPFAKAYSGLSDEEFAAVDRVIRATTIEKFGPVRSVRPTLVFEIGFEGIGASPRHKSGLAVRFPRMLRLRRDKPLHEADSLDTLRALVADG